MKTSSVAPDGRVHVPIRISFDAIESILERYNGGPLQELRLASALGRVLAHELGHVLLGRPSYHDPDGLMCATFLSDDLARPERSRFQLTNRSVERLRVRIASLSAAQALESCREPTSEEDHP